MIFPELGPQYYDEKDRPILARMETSYAESITINQSYWNEADMCNRYMVGDQTAWNDLYGNLPANRRRQFSFNRIRRVINLISGHQRRNRKSTIVTPIQNGDAETADQFTKIMMWANEQEGVLETVSEAFEGALISGMNLLQVWVDYRSDPVSGNIKVNNCSYNSFILDPYFRKQDLSDCNFIWKRTYLTKREILSLLPDQTDEVMSLHGNDQGSSRDGKFQFMPESYQYAQKNLMTYDEYYFRDFRTQKMLVDTQTGETLEWKSQDEDALKAFLQQYPQVTMVKQEIPTVKLAIVVQGRVMYDGPNPIGTDSYPFVPVFAYYNPQIPYMPHRITSVVSDLRDPQFLYNHRKRIEFDIFESQINSGFKYKENALVNPKDIFLSGQGRGLALKEEAQMSDVEQIVAPQVPPSMIQLSEIMAREIQEISGVNEELLGSATDDKAGVLSMLRQGAGLTTLQGLFDHLDYSQKLLGKLCIDIIQTNFTPGKVKQILEGEEPSQQFYNKAFGKYGAAVEDGLNTTTQRQMQFAQLLQLREAGVPVPDTILLEAATVQNKKQLIETITAANKKQQQVQEQQAQLQMQQLQAQIKVAESTAVANEGLGAERQSRVAENSALAVEREAAAEKDRDMGVLNLVKALKELEDMDINQVEKLLRVANMLKEQERTAEDMFTNKIGQSAPVQEQPISAPTA